MKLFNKNTIKKILQGMLWLALAGCSVVLLVAAVKKKNEKKCTGINVEIAGATKNFFVDKNDIVALVAKQQKGAHVGKSIAGFDLNKMENTLRRNIWVKTSQIYFDNNGILQVLVEEREPIARIFTLQGSSYYIDTSLMILPLSNKFSARLPVFTNFPSDAKVLLKKDSALLHNIKNISLHLQQDSFLNSMIDQVDITAQRTFEMIPKIGNQLIVFGDASNADAKFKRLKLFYKNIMLNAGWGRYSTINLQYNNQVVAKIRDAEDVTEDSLRTIHMMQLIAINAEKLASDSLKTFAQDTDKNTADSSMIVHSIQRDENNENIEASITAPVAPVIAVSITPLPQKSTTVKKTTTKPLKKPPIVEKTKAVMKPKPKPLVKKPNINSDY